MKLIFGKANTKLKALEKKVGKLYTFSTLSGHDCIGAKLCLSKVNEVDGKLKLTDGKNTLFRCFSASQEVLFRNVYNARKKNQLLLAGCENNVDKLTQLINDSLPKDAKIIRWFVAGDVKTKNQFIAFCNVARLNPKIIFYSYTKSVNFWLKCKDLVPDNWTITASYGGYFDDLIKPNNLKHAIVVHESEEAKIVKRYRVKNVMSKHSKYAGYLIDHSDEIAALPKHKDKNMVFMVHGIMPAGTDSARAKVILDGQGSYGKKSAKIS